MVDETEDAFRVFQKFDISGIQDITVGRRETNDIVYDTRNLISGLHAVIRRREGQYLIEDHSSNGVFVNFRRIVGSRKLEFGDCISLFVLNLVYLDKILAVQSPNSDDVGVE